MLRLFVSYISGTNRLKKVQLEDKLTNRGFSGQNRASLIIYTRSLNMASLSFLCKAAERPIEMTLIDQNRTEMMMSSDND